MTLYLSTLSSALAAGELTARALTETCLAAIASEDGERAFIEVYADRMCAFEADQIDKARQAGSRAASTLPASRFRVKDLFDVRGEVTRAGSTVLADDAAATADALVVSRLKAAGFILIGRTNMTEFAFSGLGMNPHYGDPEKPARARCGWRPGRRRLIIRQRRTQYSDGMAPATIGSDTGGSHANPGSLLWHCRPFTNQPLRGCRATGSIPLSTSFDAAGPMG